MNGVVQAAIEQQLLRAAHEVEAALDAQMHAMENMDDDDLESLRQKRVQEMKRFQHKKAEWLARGHGEVEDVEEKEFFKCAKAEERLVAHFYRNSEPCRIMDMHLQRLAVSHVETKFIRLAAEKSPFLTDRLKIWMLPTLAVVKNGKVTEYIVGFDDLGGMADFPTAALESRVRGRARTMDVIREGAGSSAPPRNILVAVNDSDQARAAAVWAGNYLAHREEDCLHLVTVLTSPDTISHGAPIPTMSAVAAMAQTIHLAHEEERANAIRLLTAVRNHLVLQHGVRCKAELHCLNSSGGASGAAHSIVLFAERHQSDVVVLGSRGLGPFKSAFASLVGQGSVSAYCLHHLSCPVAIVRGHTKALEARPEEPAFMIAVDGSPESQAALEWAGSTPLPKDASYHIVTARPSAATLVTAPESPSARVLELRERAKQMEELEQEAMNIVHEASDTLQRAGVPESSILEVTLELDEDPVGPALVHYASEHLVSAAVLGARDLGSIKRTMLSLLGAGSLSDYVMQHLPLPVIVVKRGAATESAQPNK